MTFADAVLLAQEHEEETGNILIPAWYDILWSAVVAAIIFFLFWKRVLPRLREMEATRRAGIEDKLEQAERQRVEAEELLAAYKQQLAEARTEAAQLREQARAEGQQILEEMRSRAQAEADRIVAHAHEQIEADRLQATVALRNEVGRLALDLADRIVGESLEDEARQRRVVERFLSELEQGEAAASSAQAEGRLL